MLHLFLFDTAKIRIYFYCAIKYITFLLFDVVKLFLIEKISKKQKKHKENTNFTQTTIALILNPLRTFAYNNIVFYVQRKNSTITQN